MSRNPASTFPALHALTFDELADWQKLLVRDFHFTPREIREMEEGEPGCWEQEVKEAHEDNQQRLLCQFWTDDAWCGTEVAARALMPPEEFAMEVALEVKLRWFNSQTPRRQRHELRQLKKLNISNLEEWKAHYLKHYDWLPDLRMTLSEAMLHDAPVLAASVAMVNELHDRSFKVSEGYVREGDRWVYDDREWLDLKKKLYARFGSGKVEGSALR